MSRRFFVALFALGFLFVPRAAHAQPPSPELLAKLADWADRFERQRTHASYALEGRLDVLDGDGNVDGVKELWGHVDTDGTEPFLTVFRYLEDGKDKTADAIKEAHESSERARKKRKDGKELKMPIRADEQARYVFDQAETDPAHPNRVRITFVPKEIADDTVEGSAWVDTDLGAPITAGFKLSRTPIFVDYIHFTVEFGAKTSLGPAVSKVVVDGRGGIWFFRKRFHATASLSGYHVLP